MFGSSSSPEPILHHPVPTGSPARACVIALEDQRRLSHVEFRQESAILKRRGIPDWVSCSFLPPLQTRGRPRAEIPQVSKQAKEPRGGACPNLPQTSIRPQLLHWLCSTPTVVSPTSGDHHHYHQQPPNSKRPSRFLLSGITLCTTGKNILQSCAKTQHASPSLLSFAVLEERSRCFVCLWNEA